MKIYCVACGSKVEVRLTDGSEIYPHRPDLASLPFWKHDVCGNYVGCHHNSDNPTKPKGDIPTPEVRSYRVTLHRLIDPLWQNGYIKRKHLYARMSQGMGFTYHTGNVRDRETFEKAYAVATSIKEGL